MSIKYLTAEVSDECNMNCRFCFSDWRKRAGEISTEEVKKRITALKEQGLTAINFTGGEPLMRPDIVELIEFAKASGLKVILSTNGILLADMLPKIVPNIDFIGLPIDSSNAEIHNYLRPTKSVKNHYELVVRLSGIIPNQYNIGLKINTIVTKKNVDSIIRIPEILQGEIVSWKLSQFVSSGYGAKYADEFSVSNEEYVALAQKCKDRYKNLNIIATISHERDPSCRIMSSKGILLKATLEGLVEVGGILALSSEEMSKEFNTEMNSYFLQKTYCPKSGEPK